jgi:hypothetical protein
MLLQQVAGSESITLTASHISALVDHATSPTIYSQYVGRTRRVGQKEECLHYDLCFGGFQCHIVNRLYDRRAFDKEIRNELEKLYTNYFS